MSHATMPHATPEQLIHAYIDAYNRFDVDAMCAVLASDVRFEHHSDGVLGAQASGLHAFRLLADSGAALFATRAQRITALRIDGNHAVAEIAFEGTIARELPGGPAIGSVIALSGSSEFTVADGCISRIIDRS